jgi:hypothetical protein
MVAIARRIGDSSVTQIDEPDRPDRLDLSGVPIINARIPRRTLRILAAGALAIGATVVGTATGALAAPPGVPSAATARRRQGRPVPRCLETPAAVVLLHLRAHVVGVKHAWALRITAPEKVALAGMLATC